MTYLGGMDHQKSTILWIFDIFSVGGCGGHGCYFQPNPKVISQNSASHKCTDSVFWTNKCIFDGLMSVCFGADRVGTPCIWTAPYQGNNVAAKTHVLEAINTSLRTSKFVSKAAYKYQFEGFSSRLPL